jgi:ribose transport system substrate-binding protein
MTVPITALGSKAPGRIVAYLRSHPAINRVALGYDGLGLGLPAALKATGLADKVQVIGEAPTATNLSYVQSGQQAATVGLGYYEIWANLVDAATRYMTGQSLAPKQRLQAGVLADDQGERRPGEPAKAPRSRSQRSA